MKPADYKDLKEKYDTYIQNAPDGIFVVNNRGRLLEVNEAACNLTGYSRDELMQMNIMDLIPPEGFKKALKHFAKARHTSRTSMEISCKRKDSSICYLLLEGVKAGKDKYIGYCKDITRSKELKDELIRTREFLNNIINAVADPIFVKDENHRWIVLNDSFCKFMGYKKEELIGKSDYDFFSVEEAKVFQEKDELVFLSGEENENEEYFTDAGNTTHTILTKKSIFTDKDGKKVLVGTIRNITERKKAEEERIRLASAIEHAAECVIITDSHGYVQYVNPAFEEITGYKKEEILQESIFIIENKKIDKNYSGEIWEIISKGHVWTGNIINLKKDRTAYEVETSISSIENTSGAVINYICVARDVTNEKRLERHIRQSQKLEAIGTLAGGIAHDFNNILAIMMGYTELAMRDIKKETITLKKLEGVLKAGDRARDLVKQILAFSRQTEKERKPVRISPIIKETLNFLRASLPSTIEIKKNIEANSMIMGDPTQIHQILMNLCTNASYAMKDRGGILEITLKEIEIEEEDLHNYPDLSPGSYVNLSVNDTGYGIDEEIMERIFEPFFTTKKPGEGTGMGLSVVHGIVKSYEGTISVTSEKNKGTIFSIMLPKLASGTISEPMVFKPLPRGQGNILFVDDEEELAILEKENLEELGYNVTAVTASVEALNLFRENPGHFDLIITDHTMPFITGLELIEEIKKTCPSMPFILTTGFGNLITEEKALEIGIKKLIMKPFNLYELADVISNILNRGA
jgi:PAS domain S-box-containing protein